MKTRLAFFILSSLWLVLVSCQKEDFDLNDPDVDQFVSILKQGNYFDEVGNELPDFTMTHVERLLIYSKDTSIIEEFPTNPITSFYTVPKILNECLFWTIDGIRFQNKYPSLEPVLIDTLSYFEDDGYIRLSGETLLEIADIYLEWYEEYQNHPSEIIKTKDIFINTTYRW